MSQLEWSELDFVCTSAHRAPFLELGFCNHRCVFLHSPKMKEICQNGNLENYIYTCEIRQILIKLVFQPIHRSHNNALFCVRIFFFLSVANNLCAGPYRLRKNIHHSLLCQTQTEGQIGSFPGAGGHTYLWKMEQISVAALTLTLWFKVVVLGHAGLWAADVRQPWGLAVRVGRGAAPRNRTDHTWVTTVLIIIRGWSKGWWARDCAWPGWDCSLHTDCHWLIGQLCPGRVPFLLSLEMLDPQKKRLRKTLCYLRLLVLKTLNLQDLNF